MSLLPTAARTSIGLLRSRAPCSVCPIRPDIRICFIGDSFTNGTGDDTGLGFTGRLCADLRMTHGIDVTYYNLGVRRDTSADILDRWEAEVDARLKINEHVGRLVFSFGTNDNVLENGIRRLDLDTTLMNARSILNRAKKRWPTVMLGPPWTNARTVYDGNRTISRMLGELCQEINIPYLALYDELEANVIWGCEVLAGDGIHPNHIGYDLISRAVKEWSAWESFVKSGKQCLDVVEIDSR